MSVMASQITSLTIVYSTVYSGVNHRKHQSSASMAFVWGIHRSPVNSPHKGPVPRKMFPFHDVVMKPQLPYSSCHSHSYIEAKLGQLSTVLTTKSYIFLWYFFGCWWFKLFLLNWWCHSKWPTKSQEISKSFGTSSVNSLWPSDYIWCHKSELTLTRVKGYSLTAPRQYLNQCWLRINGIHPSVIS